MGDHGELCGCLPPPVEAALDAYRETVARHGANWTESTRSAYGPLVPYLRFVPHAALFAAPVAAGLSEGLSLDDAVDTATTRDMDAAFRDALAGSVPDGLLVLRITDEGAEFASSGVVHPVLAGEPCPLLLLVESSASAPVVVEPVGEVPAGGCLTATVDARSGPLTVGGQEIALPQTVREVQKARLVLRSPEPCRWYVLSPSGRGWFPEGVLRKWDGHGRAYFHGADVTLDVPAEHLVVTAARGMDFGTATEAAAPGPGQTVHLELDPRPVRDPAADGWYGGDLHLHLNFAGDQVAGPADAARTQHGEALHVLNPLAANATTSFVYDREVLRAWPGKDLPWSTAGRVARMGAEYRNDLLGHVASFGARGEPSRYASGHSESDHPEDAPCVTTMCAEIRARGGIVTWAHPLGSDAPDPLDALFGRGTHSCAARELVVAGALDLVDGLDVLTHLSCTGTARMYRRLLGAGVRLAATAGTDVMLSYGRMGTYSNPPGWARVYARLDGPLSVPAYQDAIRAGRTFATNGPWLALDVAGHGRCSMGPKPGALTTPTSSGAPASGPCSMGPKPGALTTPTSSGAPASGPGERVAAESGQRLRVRATVTGARARVRIHDADGIVAEGDGTAEIDYAVRHPTYLVAEAQGPADPAILDPRGAYAHTSAVHVDVAGRAVARPDDLRWCLRWIERLADLVARRGRHPDPALPGLMAEAASVYRARLSP
ncbi:CehA/McbA family metallohydrolase [Actinocorallia sp. API 0066]|uniref:CehA/McbA family metallohydrolase n=1 Tax=Actinocorallia sp. API 0066 TaxID=2896846 RepID=UPI001E49AB09|nr:CehA/McbA family metallohydrolase [Actinocorallia sp. API 0066]MCD0450198.1 CehA/McbA family metallohydrolase [Actinocorallia sp. API 0066]